MPRKKKVKIEAKIKAKIEEKKIEKLDTSRRPSPEEVTAKINEIIEKIEK